MFHGDPTFPYGPRYNKRGKMTAGRGFEDVFMSDSTFDSFLPMDDFRDMRINESPFDTGHPFPRRYCMERFIIILTLDNISCAAIHCLFSKMTNDEENLAPSTSEKI